MLLNNADWLTTLNYIEFLTGYRTAFQREQDADCRELYRIRLEKGLNFIEFNYMLLQAYDFLHLFKHHGCLMQMGGNDQWGNMVAGIDLIRRMEGKTAFGMTFPLITTSAGPQDGEDRKRDRLARSPNSPLPMSITSTGSTRKTRMWSVSWPFLPFCRWRRSVRRQDADRCPSQHGQGGSGL